MILVPGDVFGFLLQLAQDVRTHRLLPIPALAENEVVSLRVEGSDVDLGIGVPIASDPGEVERPGVVCIQIPHFFPAHILIDEGDMTGDQALADLVQNDLTVAA